MLTQVSASKRFLNLACGASYVQDGQWTNLDYTPSGRGVVQADLLGRLPFGDGGFDLVYTSHFVEHIPRPRVASFLAECRRVLRPGGTLRVVVPDFEEMCRTYLQQRAAGSEVLADCLALEILDQCVRKRSGGELAELYAKVAQEKDADLAAFIFERCGEDLRPHRPAPAEATVAAPPTLGARARRYLERRYVRAVCSLLPRAFREQNVSLAEVGETHAWLYDFEALSRLVGAAGFGDVRRVRFDNSRVAEFPCVPLDATPEGEPRKGRQSLYLEAAAA